MAIPAYKAPKGLEWWLGVIWSWVGLVLNAYGILYVNGVVPYTGPSSTILILNPLISGLLLAGIATVCVIALHRLYGRVGNDRLDAAAFTALAVLGCMVALSFFLPQGSTSNLGNEPSASAAPPKTIREARGRIHYSDSPDIVRKSMGNPTVVESSGQGSEEIWTYRLQDGTLELAISGRGVTGYEARDLSGRVIDSDFAQSR